MYKRQARKLRSGYAAGHKAVNEYYIFEAGENYFKGGLPVLAVEFFNREEGQREYEEWLKEHGALQALTVAA